MVMATQEKSNSNNVIKFSDNSRLPNAAFQNVVFLIVVVTQQMLMNYFMLISLFCFLHIIVCICSCLLAFCHCVLCRIILALHISAEWLCFCSCIVKKLVTSTAVCVFVTCVLVLQMSLMIIYWNKLVSLARLMQYLTHGTFWLAGPLGQLPPKHETQCRWQTSILVQNFSQICLAVLEKMRPKETKNKLNILLPWYQFVRNDDVQRLMKQPKLTAISSRAGLPCLGILCAWTTMQMPRGSC